MLAGSHPDLSSVCRAIVGTTKAPTTAVAQECHTGYLRSKTESLVFEVLDATRSNHNILSHVLSARNPILKKLILVHGAGTPESSDTEIPSF